MLRFRPHVRFTCNGGRRMGRSSAWGTTERRWPCICYCYTERVARRYLVPRDNQRAGGTQLRHEQNQLHPAGSSGNEALCPVMLCLLGNFRLLVAEELIPIHPGGKSEALLSLLALQYGRRMPRERLVQTLWPMRDLALGLRSLNTLVYNLHKLLGSALNGAAPVLHEEGYYRL